MAKSADSKLSWFVLGAIVLGVGVGWALRTLDPGEHLDLTFDARGVITELASGYSGPLRVGDRILSFGSTDGAATARSIEIDTDWVGSRIDVGADREGAEVRSREWVRMGAESTRAWALSPFEYLADLFRRLLQMLIVPLIGVSIVSAVAGLGNLAALRQIGVRDLLVYLVSSALAVGLGLALVNWMQPGATAGSLPLDESVEAARLSGGDSFARILIRAVPTNVFEALSSNGSILQVIFVSILAGIFIPRLKVESSELLQRVFRALFDLMLHIAEYVLRFIPIGVFVLVVRVIGASGFAQFAPLLVYMYTVALGLLIHAVVVLPTILFLAGVSPLRWARAALPAVTTAFSTSSSSMTLPVTLRAVENGGVSRRVSSFVLPLGATVNMDGTALYECVGVLFLAQYYAAAGDFEISAGTQLTVAATALLASIGAAGIPSAGLVMMTTILSQLGLPIEAALLLLAVDRPLDMLRTSVNIWSDTSCAAVVARSLGEKLNDPQNPDDPQSPDDPDGAGESPE
ncbi:MAG: dicarboxylate/amino acid:cation symporter [Planctomycetota bacterium]